VKLTGYGAIEQTSKGHSNPFDQFSKLQFAWDWEFEVHPEGTWSMLLHKLYDGKGFVVSNGSFCQGSGAAAWILEGTTLLNQIRGECFVPGHDDGHSSFGSELVGIYYMLLFLYQVCHPQSLHMSWSGRIHGCQLPSPLS